MFAFWVVWPPFMALHCSSLTNLRCIMHLRSNTTSRQRSVGVVVHLSLCASKIQRKQDEPQVSAGDIRGQ